MGAINQLNKFIPNLAVLCSPLRPLLSKSPQFQWEPAHTEAFNLIKEHISQIASTHHYDITLPTRIVCDASHDGLGATLEQCDVYHSNWRPIAFASRFLNAAELKYSTNELELLAIVWATEHFRNYIYGRPFSVITDHQALLSALKPNRGNKTYFSRLTRWVDKLLPFDFDINHKPGSKMGIVDYLSRHPTEKATPVSHYDEQFVLAVINKCRHDLHFPPLLSANETTRPHIVNQSESDTAYLLKHAPRICFSHRSSHGRSFNEIKWNSCSHALQLQLLDALFTQLPSFDFHTPLLKLNMRPSATTSPSRPTYTAIAKTLPQSPSDEIVILSSDDSPIKTEPLKSSPTKAQPPALTKSVPPVTFPAVALVNPDFSPLNAFDGINSTFHVLFDNKFISLATSNDAILSRVKQAVLTRNLLPLKLRELYFFRLFGHLHVRSGCLFYDNRLVVPTSLQDAILQRLHEDHSGSQAMLDRASNIWWPHMRQSIKYLASNCDDCSYVGKNLKPLLPHSQVGSLAHPTRANEILELDFCGPLRCAHKTKNYILVAIDRYTKFVTTKLCSSPTAWTVRDFLTAYMRDNGRVHTIVSDQGAAFTSAQLATFTSLNCIHHEFAPSGDHRGIGTVERAIGTIRSRLTAMRLSQGTSFALKPALTLVTRNLRHQPVPSHPYSVKEFHFFGRCSGQTSGFQSHPSSRFRLSPSSNC